TLAAAELGIRHFSRCDTHLRAVERSAGHSRDIYSQLNVRALRARMSLIQQQPKSALELTKDDFAEVSSRAMYGEYLATRALALAVLGERRAAIKAAGAAELTTRSIDVRVLSAGARSLALSDRVGGNDAAHLLLDTASKFGVWDGVVCAVRAR